MKIHTFGDSHSRFGWDCIKKQNIEIHHIGAKLAFSIGSRKEKLLCLENYEIENGDTIVFSFGEIDCRCHVHKHAIHGKTYKNVIDDIVNNYIDAVNIITLNSGLKFKNICIYNIVPPTEKHNIKENKRYPHLGSDQERKSYILYFNKKLKEKCNENNWIFVDVYDKYCDNNGFLRKDLSDSKVHIQNPIFLEEYIIKYLQ